jgi:hypothetical protein
MRRGTVIVVIFIVVAVAIVGLSQFLRAQPALDMTLAVSPLAERWVRAAVESFNASEPIVNNTQRLHITVVPVEDEAVWRDERRVNWTTQEHPVAWIPASSLSAAYAVEARFPMEIVTPSLAQTPLMWGGFKSRVDVVTENGTKPLDWESVQAAAEAESWSSLGGQPNWQFVKLAFDAPDQSISGLAVLFSGAADYSDTPDVTGAITSGTDFRNWFAPVAASVPNFATLGADPAAAMASRGASVAEIGLLPESRWLLNLEGLLKNEPVQLAYPAYPFVFDFPLVRWNDTSTTVEQQQAVDALNGWMTGGAEQANTVIFGLRPASGVAPASAALFSAGSAYGVNGAAITGTPVSGPPRNDSQRLLQWFNTAR